MSPQVFQSLTCLGEQATPVTHPYAEAHLTMLSHAATLMRPAPSIQTEANGVHGRFPVVPEAASRSQAARDRDAWRHVGR